MNGTTNIYILADVSLSMRRHADELQRMLSKTARALSFLHEKSDLHLIGFQDTPCTLPHGGQPRSRRGIKVSQKRFALCAEVQRQKDAFGVLAVFVGECSLRLE